jgi:thiamine-monophosphate kinase
MSPRLGEFARIDRFLKPLARDTEGALGLVDDAGLIAPPPGRQLVVTTDAMVEGVHYLPGEEPARLGRKLLRVNLSDLAAMGAAPLAYTLTTVLPADLADDWLERLAAGLAEDQARYGIGLLGGDSVSTPGPVVLSVTAMGTVAAGRALTRAGARPGDRVYASGTLGDGHLGLYAARGDLSERDADAATIAALAGRYHLPEPRLAVGRGLAGLATAAIDLSDGLPGDLGHICAASGTGAQVEAARVPLSPAARTVVAARADLLRTALAGGDDYELLFTAPPHASDAVAALAAGTGVPLTDIGEIVAGSGVAIVDAGGDPIPGLSGWSHF